MWAGILILVYTFGIIVRELIRDKKIIQEEETLQEKETIEYAKSLANTPMEISNLIEKYDK